MSDTETINRKEINKNKDAISTIQQDVASIKTTLESATIIIKTPISIKDMVKIGSITFISMFAGVQAGGVVVTWMKKH